ncbi:MAG: catechol 1,2-dioxygenase [Parcubacteria group bacterium]|nr:catechol 1,2-dioxygenase [Parcubacteria group bacterium]
MGEIVGAVLCSHIPRLMMSPEDRLRYTHGTPTTFFDALAQMKAKLDALDFETFIVFDTHWNALTHVVIDGRDRHKGTYTSEEVPLMIHDLPFDYDGDNDLAYAIAMHARMNNIRAVVAYQKGLPYHYPTLVPMHFLNHGGAHRVLPIGNNFTTSVQNDLDFGKAIQHAVRETNRRVVLVASGGLSHKFHPFDDLLERASPDPSNIPQKNREWDELIIGLLKSGEHEAVIDRVQEYRRVASPEGRFSHYLRMVGALGGKYCTLKAEQFGEYEAAVGTGQVNLWFEVPQNP